MALFFNFDLMTLGVNTIPLAEKLRIQEEHILELLRTNSVTRVFIGPMCTWGPIIGSPCPSLRTSKTLLKPCEDIVKTVNVVNVVKI